VLRRELGRRLLDQHLRHRVRLLRRSAISKRTEHSGRVQN
jgi:hypothetical protein